MKRILVAILILSVVLFGCIETSTIDTSQDRREAESAADEPVVKEEVSAPPLEEPEEEPEEVPEVEGCDISIPAENMDSIDLTILRDGLQKTDEGIKFRLLPLDKDGNILAITGNLKVSLWTTKKLSGQILEDTEIYVKSFNIKKENAAADCSSQEMLISFDDIKASGKYKFVKEDDMGILRFEFRRTGSTMLYEQNYNGADFEQRIWP